MSSQTVRERSGTSGLNCEGSTSIGHRNPDQGWAAYAKDPSPSWTSALEKRLRVSTKTVMFVPKGDGPGRLRSHPGTTYDARALATDPSSVADAKMPTMGETLTISTKGISDFKDGELEEIVEAIRDAAPDLEVTLEDPQRMEKGRYGVVWGEILQLFFSAGFGYAFNSAVNAAVKRAREGWEEKQKDKPRPRPRIVSIHGPDGRIIRNVRVDEDEGKDFDIGRLEESDEKETGDEA